jgi:hypothetical protein
VVPKPATKTWADCPPFSRNHINLLGRYSLLLPSGLRRGLRPLRDPSAVDADEEDGEPS